MKRWEGFKHTVSVIIIDNIFIAVYRYTDN